MIRNPPCDTKKLCHAALLPVQLVHLLEHFVSQNTHSCYARETKLQRVALRDALRDANSNDAILIATTRIAVNQALKLQN